MIKKIYTAGGMSNLSYSEMSGWREQLKKDIQSADKKTEVFNPVEHFSFEEVKANLADEREIMNFDLFNLKTSDLVVMNFNDPKSIGTAAELGIAYDRHIPVIGLNVHNYDLHPWQIEICEKIFTNYEDLFIYLIKHYL